MWSQGVGVSARADASLRTHICVLIVFLFVRYRKKTKIKTHYFDCKKYYVLGVFSLKVFEENKFDYFVSLGFDFFDFLVHGF